MSQLHQVAQPSDPPRGRDTDLEWFRGELEEQRRFRLDQLRDLSYAAATAPAGAQGEVTEALMTGARTVLAEIDAALFRLAIGSFGRCQRCSDEISPERLEVIPMASLCLSCHYSTGS